ncbi:MAG: hemerythrin domain-containing protein [Magnetospirillum sp.]|nr:hemerythrin domain-containing protein [Magnetospirillum sp.]
MSVTDAKGSSHSEPRDQLQQLQDDVATLRQQTATALRLLAAILSTMKDLTRREGNIEHGIAELSHEIDGMLMPHPPPPETCPSLRLAAGSTSGAFGRFVHLFRLRLEPVRGAAGRRADASPARHRPTRRVRGHAHAVGRQLREAAMHLLDRLLHHDAPPPPQELIHWDGSFSVGNGLLDNEHHDIVATLNALYDHSHGQHHPMDLEHMVERLERTLRTHFSNEEEVLARHRCPDLPSHHAEHGQILAELERAKGALAKDSGAGENALTRLVRRIVLNHILVTDMDARDYLRE